MLCEADTDPLERSPQPHGRRLARPWRPCAQSDQLALGGLVAAFLAADFCWVRALKTDPSSLPTVTPVVWDLTWASASRTCARRSCLIDSGPVSAAVVLTSQVRGRGRVPDHTGSVPGLSLFFNLPG
jgi:hypothetical protein